MGVNNLKDYLTIRGISVSGYSKVELVARAFSAAEIELPIILSSEEQTRVLYQQYNKRLKELRLLDHNKVPNHCKVDECSYFDSMQLF